MKLSNTCPITLKSMFFKLEKSSNILPLLVSLVSKIYLSFVFSVSTSFSIKSKSLSTFLKVSIFSFISLEEVLTVFSI